MGAEDAASVWARLAGQTAPRREELSDGDLVALAGQVSDIVRLFLRDVWARHRPSLEQWTADGLKRVRLGDSPVQFSAAGARGIFETRVGSLKLEVCLDGTWGYYREDGDDYVPDLCAFGYHDGGQLRTEQRAYATFVNMSPNQLIEATATPLMQCVNAEW